MPAFPATARRYCYYIYNAPVRPAILAPAVTWEPRELDLALMQQALPYLQGQHDFSAFRAKQCQAHSPVREIIELSLTQIGPIIELNIKANGFLHHMVRNIIGVLLAIGRGDRPPIWAQEVLESRQRVLAGVTAKPSGLYLVEVEYPKHYNLGLVYAIHGF